MSLTLPVGRAVDDDRPLTIDLACHPHVLLTGPADTGKTTLLRQMADTFREQGGEVIDASFRDESDSFWWEPRVISERIESFYEELVRRQRAANGDRSQPVLLTMDDWDYIDPLLIFGWSDEGRRAADMVKIVSRIFTMGRPFNMHCIVSTQQVQARSVPGSLLANARTRIVLGCPRVFEIDRLFCDYEHAAAAAARITPEMRGRGLVSSEDRPIVFQMDGPDE